MRPTRVRQQCRVSAVTLTGHGPVRHKNKAQALHKAAGRTPMGDQTNPAVNRQVYLAERPDDIPQAHHFALREVPAVVPGA